MKLERELTDNDVYFIAVVQDKIIVNDNYDGILIFNHDLEVIKRCRLFNDMVIDTSFVKNNEIVFHCYENRCFIHLNIETYVCTLIPLSDALSDFSFLSLYEWENDELVLLADDGAVLVSIDLLNHVVSQGGTTKTVLSVTQDWEKLNKFIVHKVYPEKHIAIVEAERECQIMYYRNNSAVTLNTKGIVFYDIEVLEKAVVFVNESEVYVLYGGESVKLSPATEGYYFLRCKFIEVHGVKYLFLLSCDNADNSICKLERYAVEADLFPVFA